MTKSKKRVHPKTINLADFDFNVDRTRQKILSNDSYDGSATIRLPGKNRKTANHELILIPFMRKNKLSFKKVAIGKNKHNNNHIMVFDNPTLEVDNAVIRAYGKPPSQGFINSKGHVEKLFKLLGVAIPQKSNDVVKLYFRLIPTRKGGNSLNFKICIISTIQKGVTDNKGAKRIKKKAKGAPIKVAKKADKNNFL